jgi:hypothetical protein
VPEKARMTSEEELPSKMSDSQPGAKIVDRRHSREVLEGELN